MPTRPDKKIDLVKGERLKLKIDSLIFGGEGLARHSSVVIFVPFTAPGDEIEAEIEEVKKNFARARLINIITPSAQRIKPICPHFFNEQNLTGTTEAGQLHCGGCAWQHINYPTQLQQKTHLVKEALTYIGKLKDVTVHEIIGARNEFSYRNKIQEAAGSRDNAGKKEIIFGFYAPDSHNLLDIKNCYLQPTIANEIIYFCKNIFNEYEIPAYDEKFHRDLIRHLIVRQSLPTREVMLIIVTRDKELPNMPDIVDRLTIEFPQIKSIIQNINKDKTNKILGDYSRVLFGQESIGEKIGGLNFKISPTSFFQVNTQQAEVLYKTIGHFIAVEAAAAENQGKKPLIIDVFSGTGAIALWLAPFSEKVYGVEVNEEAVRDAINNAELNNITNCEFRLGEAELVLKRMHKNGLRPDTIILDPPRKGCTRKLLEAVKTLDPRQIIYVSCEPTTLARDLHYLDKLKYKTLEVQPVDMFPQTAHIECVARVLKK